MQRPIHSRTSLAALLVTALTFSLAVRVQAQTFEILATFDGVNGDGPNGPLVQGTDGNLYGTTDGGGTQGKAGTVFRVTPTGDLSSLYSFTCTQSACPNGTNPFAGLIQGFDGKFYGSTQILGASRFGTIFAINKEGTLTTLHSFQGSDGDGPYQALIQATDGNFYGVTAAGGTMWDGTAFRMTPKGTLTRLYSFCAQTNCADGEFPSGLIQATDGNFYGTTYGGGASNGGTVFKLTPAGVLTTLHSFYSSVTTGLLPYASLVQGTDGNFYGTTAHGTSSKSGGGSSCGTVFRITHTGTFTTMHIFANSDGCFPYAPLIQATDGNFYGTTPGTMFSITATGTLTTLHTFSAAEGSPDYAGLMQATDGNFYGTTDSEGANSDSTVFKFSAGLGPFVKTLPTSGKVGATVEILGTDLTGTTSVTFDGTAATFTVVSSSEITATVPNGAKTGTVRAVTPGGALTGNVSFRVN